MPIIVQAYASMIAAYGFEGDPVDPSEARGEVRGIITTMHDILSVIMKGDLGS